MRKILLSILLVCFCFFLNLAAQANHSTKTTKSAEPLTNQQILAQFPLAEGEAILVPVTLKNKTYSFVLDTGSSITVFDLSLKDQLGKPKKTGTMFTQAGPTKTEGFESPQAFLGPLDLQEKGLVGCKDLAMFSSIAGRKISGIIGINSLRKYVVQMDFDNGQLRFLKPTTGKQPDWGQPLEIEYHPIGAAYICGIILDDVKVDFIIDTGCNYTGEIHRLIFEQMTRQKQIKTTQTLEQTAAGIKKARAARINKLRIGPFEYKDLILGEGSFSMLGLGFLRRHLVTFDFPNNKLYLKKGKSFEEPDEEDMSGLHILRFSDKTVVHSVDKDSPAYKAGIKANDIILKVNNKDANEYLMWKLRRVLKAGDKQKISMTIKNGQDVKKTTFLLEKKI